MGGRPEVGDDNAGSNDIDLRTGVVGEVMRSSPADRSTTSEVVRSPSPTRLSAAVAASLDACSSSANVAMISSSEDCLRWGGCAESLTDRR